MMRISLLTFGALLCALLISVSCGGGGGGRTLLPSLSSPTPPAATIMDAAKQFPNGTVIEAAIYRSMTDDEPLENGSEFGLGPGEAINFSARAWAQLLQPDGSYRREEITAIPGMEFVWAYRGLDGNNAGLTENLEQTLAQITIAYSDLPEGGKYDLSVRAEIAPADLVSYVNGRLEEARRNQPPPPQSTDGGGDDDDIWWAAGGFLLGLMICPSDSAGVIIVSIPDEPSPKPPPVNQPPIAIAQATPGTGQAPLTVEFIGSNSYDPDPDGTIVGYLWSYDDGGGGNGAEPTHTFVSPGEYHVTLTVWDNDGATGEATLVIVVNQPQAENQAPVASFVVSPASGEVPLTIDVDGTGSYDPDGIIVEYRWYFYGGGGTFVGGNLPTTSYTYNAPGTYTVWLVVVDDDGKTDWSDPGVEIVVTESDTSLTWGGEAFRGEDVFLDVNPSGLVLDSGELQTQQFTADLFEGGELRISGVGGKYFTLEWSTTAPSGSLSIDGYFDSVVAGPGSYTVTATAILQTLPEPTVIARVVNVTVI